MPAARRFAWFEAPPGWSDEAWRASVTAALGELANWRDDVRDKRMRPWLYEPERSDPSLKRILDKLDEMNRRARGRPTLVALAHEAGISDRHIQRVLRRYGLSWKRTRDYRHT